MGQYFEIVNLDKKQYINPHNISTGAKVWEISANSTGLIAYMLAHDWHGDRVALVGDYQNPDLYSKVHKEFEEVSEKYIPHFNEFIRHKEYKLPSTSFNNVHIEGHEITVKAEITQGMNIYKDGDERKINYYNTRDKSDKKKWFCSCGEEFGSEEKAVKHLELVETVQEL